MKSWRLDSHRVRELTDEASRGRDVSPLPLVAEWIDAFFELVHGADTEDPQIAYDLLAAWARLWRTSPALLSTAGGVSIPDDRRIEEHRWSELFNAGRYREDEEVLRKRLPELAELAVSVPDPYAWIEELEDFAQQVEESSGADLASWAIDLIEDLDSAELVHWVARRYLGETKAVVDLGIRLKAAHLALLDKAGAFVVAPDFVVAFAKALDYAPPDELLLESAWKASVLLEEIVEYTRFVKTAETRTEALSAARALVSGLLVEHFVIALKTVAAACRRARQPALAAGPEQAAQTMPVAELRWLSPDREYIAVVDLPPQIVESVSSLPVRVKRVLLVGGSPMPGPIASEFRGRRARLAGIEATVEEDAKAEFPLEVLATALEQGANPLFEVESDEGWVTWIPLAVAELQKEEK